MAANDHGSTQTPGTGEIGVSRPMTRRDFLKVAGVAGAAVGAAGGLSGFVAGCGSSGSSSGSSSSGTGRAIKVGFVAPLTGPLAAFGEADQFCLDQWNAAVKNGVQCGDGKTHPITIIMKDSQSDSNRAATVAADLITNDGVDILMAASTPDTVAPAADQAEALGVPFVSTDCPWQPFYFGRGATPAKPFKWTYNAFWGTESAAQVFIDIWNKIQTNKLIGAMWPNDADGNAWADKKTGMPSKFGPAGYKFIDGGRYQDGSQDFSAQITKFKSAGCQILNGVMIPPDFTNFWKQTLQQGYHPKIVTMAKALLFPSAVEALGNTGVGLTTECWWTPNHPFKSSLTGQTCKEFADGFTAATGKQWTQPLMHYIVFEIVVDALKRATNVDSKDNIVAAVKATQLDTLAGHIDWTSGGPKNPVPNVSVTPLVSSQWVKGTQYKYDIVVVANSLAPEVPVQAEPQVIKY
jgi:branched-chain amino acid transport system substrate-binding protein